MGPGPWRDRGSHALRRGRRARGKFSGLKKKTGGFKRRLRGLRPRVLEAAGGAPASPQDVVAAVKAVLTPEERQLLAEEAKNAVRSEVARESDWLYWSDLGRQLAPLVLKTLGSSGEAVVVQAAKTCAS